MAIITLLTDFGTTDPFVGIMKGVILQINPQADIVDISHGIDPQDVVRAAHEVAYYYRYFPEDTVHIVVVDPGVGSDRAILAMRSRAQTLLAPDNGALSLVLQDHPVQELIRVTNERFFRHPVSRTFHGRDIFAPVAAHLSVGLPFAELGQSVSPGEAVVLTVPKPRQTKDGSLLGSILSVDRFGNLITDVDPDAARRFFPDTDPKNLVFIIGEQVITGVAETYDAGDPGQPLVLIGSRGCFEICVNRGSAAGLLGAGRWDRFTVRPDRAGSGKAV
jgi:S-adenosylmethionine hydrolase